MKKKILAVALSTLMVCTMTAALYACGGEDPTTYTVTYTNGNDAETGTLPTDENEYKEGDKVTLKPASYLSLGNYHFVGWNDGTATYKITDEYTMPAKDVTFKAVWGYTVSFFNKRTDEDMILLGNEYHTGDTITLIEQPTDFTDENGRIFSGWYTIENLEAVYYEAGATYTIPAQDVEFYAHWRSTSIKATFYLEQGISGAAYATKTYAIGDTIVIELPDNPADKTEGGKVYEFDGWYRNDNEDVKFTLNTVFSEQDKEYGAISLFAKWKEKTNQGEQEKTYSVIYLSSRTQGVTLATAEYKAGASVTVLGKPATLEGDTEFLGWIDDGTEYEAGDTFTMPAQNVALYPNWEEADGIAILYHIDKDSYDSYVPLKTVTVATDGTITLPDINTFTADELGKYAEGYTFDGWYYWDLEAGEAKVFNSSYTITADDLDEGAVYVYAVWTAVS